MFLSVCKLIIVICLIFDLRLLVNELTEHKVYHYRVRLSNGRHVDYYAHRNISNKHPASCVSYYPEIHS